MHRAHSAGLRDSLRSPASFLIAGAIVGFLILGLALEHVTGTWLATDASNSGTRLELAVWGIAATAGLVLLLGKRSKGALLIVLLLMAVSVVALYGATHLSGPTASPTVAVGLTQYLGLSIARDTRAIYAMYGITTLVAIALVSALRWLRRPTSDRLTDLTAREGTIERRPDAVHSVAPNGSRHGHAGLVPRLIACLVIAVSVGLALAAYLPDLQSIAASAGAMQYVPNWDGNNFVAWAFFASHGFVPMKDFWYPYENDLVFQSSLVGGQLSYFLYQCVGTLGYAWVFWRLSGRRAIVTCLAVAGLILAEPLIGEFSRYGFAFMVGLVFCVVRETEASRARLWSRLALTFVVGIAAFIEADLLAYAGIGVVAVVLLECASRLWPPDPTDITQPDWRRWALDLSADLLGPVLVIVAAVAFSATRGQLGNMISFYGQPGTLEAYSGDAIPLLNGIKSLPSLNVALVWLPAVFFGGSIVFRWIAPRAVNALLASTLAVVGSAGALLLVKDAVRPLTGELPLILVLDILLCLVAAVERLLSGRRLVAPAAVGIMVGFLAATVAISGEASALTSGVRGMPARLYRDFNVVVSPDTTVHNAERTRFASTHFTQFPGDLALAKVIKPLIGRSSSNLYVLGDDPIQYVLLRQQPPWEVNVYNTSPIGDQRHVISWIETHKPGVVVLDRQDSQVFDSVPDDVRIPLVYQDIVAAYEPETTVGGFDVLRRRQADEKPTASFWLNRLGHVLDLGAIPGVEPPVPGDDAGGTPTPVLEVRATVRTPTDHVSIPLSFGGTVVTVRFRALPGRRSYEIPVDRLWPWALSHHVRIARAPTPGWSVTMSSGSMSENRLY